MDRFTDAYNKARDVVSQQKFSTEWAKFLKDDVRVKSLLAPDGPNYAQADGLDKIRKKLADDSHNALVAFFVGGGTADTIVEACKNDGGAGRLDERAATIKMLKHLYFSRKRGAQDVWIYSPPKSYALWIHEEIVGAEDAIKQKLKKEHEVYSSKEKQYMCDALQLALKWSLDVCAKLGDPDEKAKAMVSRWFADEDTSDADLTKAISSLNEGFKKIANVANSNSLIFSDEPIDRNKGGWKDWAFVYKSEKMDVVYLQGAFLKAGNSGKLWMCALTIIHELSHRAVGTSDHRYDSSGLKPHKTRFPHAKAIDNADSWAYFATDLAGNLSDSDRKKTLV